MTKTINFTYEDRQVKVPVSDELYAHWQDQIHQVKGNRADGRRKTVMNLMRAAYAKGLAGSPTGSGSAA